MASIKSRLKINSVSLEQLFGSRTRVKMLKLFLNNADRPYFVREIARVTNSQINSVRRELFNLKNLGIVQEIVNPPENLMLATDRQKKFLGKLKPVKRNDILKKFFQINNDFILCPELKALLLKADFLLEKNFAKLIARTGLVDYLVLTGSFVGLPQIGVDLFLVGRFNRPKLIRLIRNFEKDFGREINYTVMSRQEFRYRKDITDRFLYNILENKKIVMINQLDRI